jgi:hypothetical protein
MWPMARATFRTEDGRTTQVSAQKKPVAGAGQAAIHPDDLPKSLEAWRKMVAGLHISLRFDCLFGRTSLAT